VNVRAKFEVRSFHPFSDNSDWSFGWGLRTLNLGEEKVIGGQGWYHSKECRCVPVTVPLSVRVSDILPPLCFNTPLFPTPPSFLKISPCFPSSR